MKSEDDSSWQESDDKLRQCVEKQRHHSAYKSLYGQGCGLPTGHIWLWELDCKKGRTLKKWCLQTVLLRKTPESPLDSKEIKPVNLKGDNPEYSQAGMMLKLKLQYFGHLMQTDDSLENSLILGRSKGRGREGIKGWNGWMASPLQWTWTWATLGAGEGQGGLVYCSP